VVSDVLSGAARVASGLTRRWAPSGKAIGPTASHHQTGFSRVLLPADGAGEALTDRAGMSPLTVDEALQRLEGSKVLEGSGVVRPGSKARWRH
jgi:hypothetical protein